MTVFEKIKVDERQASLVPDEKQAITTEEKTKIEDSIDDLMFALQAPLVVWKGYERDSPEEWKHQAQMSRLAALLRPEREREMCTDLELCFYLSGYTLEIVPSHEIGRVYTYAFRKAYGEEKADAIGLEKIDELSDYPERDLYLRTKRWIFKQQYNHLKAMDKERDKEKPEPHTDQDVQGESQATFDR